MTDWTRWNKCNKVWSSVTSFFKWRFHSHRLLLKLPSIMERTFKRHCFWFNCNNFTFCSTGNSKWKGRRESNHKMFSYCIGAGCISCAVLLHIPLLHWFWFCVLCSPYILPQPPWKPFCSSISWQCINIFTSDQCNMGDFYCRSNSTENYSTKHGQNCIRIFPRLFGGTEGILHNVL